MHGGRELVPPEDMKFNKERLNGAINEIAGRARRQVGEWTGDKTAVVNGLAQEMKGKAQQAWCGVKDALKAIKVDEAERQVLGDRADQGFVPGPGPTVDALGAGSARRGKQQY